MGKKVLIMAGAFLMLAVSLFPLVEIKGSQKALNGSDEFEYQGSVYTVVSRKNHTCALKKAGNLLSYDGKCYEQDGLVYNRNTEYKVTVIGYQAFWTDENISFELKLPETVTRLKSECMGCNITKLDMKDTAVKTIPSYLFSVYNDSGKVVPLISEVELPKECKTISGLAFWGCKKIKSLRIPESVKKIGIRSIDTKCMELYFEGMPPKSILKLIMKSAVLYVKEEYYLDSLDLLIKPISLGKCEVKIFQNENP